MVSFNLELKPGSPFHGKGEVVVSKSKKLAGHKVSSVQFMAGQKPNCDWFYQDNFLRYGLDLWCDLHAGGQDYDIGNQLTVYLHKRYPKSSWVFNRDGSLSPLYAQHMAIGLKEAPGATAAPLVLVSSLMSDNVLKFKIPAAAREEPLLPGQETKIQQEILEYRANGLVLRVKPGSNMAGKIDGLYLAGQDLKAGKSKDLLAVRVG
jgi:hypothetical protein